MPGRFARALRGRLDGDEYMEAKKLGRLAYHEIVHEAAESGLKEVDVSDDLLRRLAIDAGIRGEANIARFIEGYDKRSETMEDLRKALFIDDFSYFGDRVYCEICDGMYLPHEH